MTIIQPNQKHYYLRSTTIFVILSIALAVFLNIYFYNSIVDLKHSLSLKTKDFQTGQVINAELKNTLYKILDLQNLKQMTAELSLVRDAHPAYLEPEVAVVAQKVNH